MTTDWGRIAAGVQRAVQVERHAIFPDGELLPISLPELATIHASAGSGLSLPESCFWRRTPGGGGDAQVEVKALDRTVAEALLRLKAAPGEVAGTVLRSVYEAFRSQAPTIGMSTLLGRVLEALGEDREMVAFMNLCPFRTREDADFNSRTTQRCMDLVLAPILDALKPDTVVLLGAVARCAAPHLQTRWVYEMPRGRNDKQLNRGALPNLQAIRSSRGERAAGRIASSAR